MNLSVILHNAFTYSTILNVIPAAILCYLPMQNQIRVPVKRIIRNCAIMFIISYVLLQVFNYLWPELNVTLMLLPFLFVFFLYYYYSVRAMFVQCIAIFASVCTICSITSVLASLIRSVVPESMYLPHMNVWFMLLDVALTYVICVAFMPSFHHSGSAMVDGMQQPQIWIISLPFSLLTFIMMVAMTLHRYGLLENEVSREFSLMLFAGVAVIYFFSVILFGAISHMILRDEKYKTREIVYRIQRKQYTEIKNVLENLRVFRHDTRHMMRTISQMAKKGETEEIVRFLEQKSTELPDAKMMIFCDNSIINAVLNYYLEQARSYHISSEIAVDLPELTERQTIDLSSLLANLLENAILACKEVPEEDRKMDLAIRSSGDSAIFIVETNSFDGTVKTRRGEYMSTRSGNGGTGLGMRSMRAVTERYRGTMKAYHRGLMFYVDIMMRVEKPGSNAG